MKNKDIDSDKKYIKKSDKKLTCMSEYDTWFSKQRPLQSMLLGKSVKISITLRCSIILQTNSIRIWIGFDEVVINK